LRCASIPDFETVFALLPSEAESGGQSGGDAQAGGTTVLDAAHPDRCPEIVADYLILNRLEEATATGRQTEARNLDSPFLRIYMYQVAFLQNDLTGMAEQVSWFENKPEVEDAVRANEAETAAYSGLLVKSRDFVFAAISR
jgi:hypothetical protein